jgi:GntR family transcriptional regulator
MAEHAIAGMSGTDIDRKGPIPYHYQLRELIRNEIAGGRWEVGERLPSEREWCETFNLSRTTVREALDALVQEGLLQREQGRGTFVAEPKIMESWLGLPDGFTESMSKEGYRIETKVLNLAIIRAPHNVAKKLRLGGEAPVIVLDRLRSELSEPLLLVTSYLPERFCPTLIDRDFTSASLYATLREECGIEIARAQRCMEAVAANELEAKLLNVKPGSPLMLIESTAYLENGTPIEYFKARHRGDRTRFQVDAYKPVLSLQK